MTEQTAFIFTAPTSRQGFITTGPTPTHLLSLWEADQAVWEVRTLSLNDDESVSTQRWVPRGPDHIMQDALLMIMVLVLEFPEGRQLLESAGVDLASDYVDLTGVNVPPRVYDLIPTVLSTMVGITACVLAGSSIESQLGHLTNLAGEIEILRSAYRSFD